MADGEELAPASAGDRCIVALGLGGPAKSRVSKSIDFASYSGGRMLASAANASSAPYSASAMSKHSHPLVDSASVNIKRRRRRQRHVEAAARVLLLDEAALRLDAEHAQRQHGGGDQQAEPECPAS